jgi:hypothetical protein
VTHNEAESSTLRKTRAELHCSSTDMNARKLDWSEGILRRLLVRQYSRASLLEEDISSVTSAVVKWYYCRLDRTTVAGYSLFRIVLTSSVQIRTLQLSLSKFFTTSKYRDLDEQGFLK